MGRPCTGSQAISKANPDLSPADLFWRLHFTLGTVVFTMASADALRDIAQADFGQQLDVEGLVRNVIPYLASGVGAPVESTRLSPGRVTPNNNQRKQ